LRPLALPLQLLERSQPLRHHPQGRGGRGRTAGSPHAGKLSTSTSGANTGHRVLPARASPLRSAAMITARPPAPVPCAARARSAASHGRKPAGTPASVSGDCAFRMRFRRFAHLAVLMKSRRLKASIMGP
jgi:hypothetical protein